jgi:hypothetical protein
VPLSCVSALIVKGHPGIAAPQPFRFQLIPAALAQTLGRRLSLSLMRRLRDSC